MPPLTSPFAHPWVSSASSASLPPQLECVPSPSPAWLNLAWASLDPSMLRRGQSQRPASECRPAA